MSATKEILVGVTVTVVIGVGALLWKPVQHLFESWHTQTQEELLLQQKALLLNIKELEDTNQELTKIIDGLQELSWTRNGRARISSADFGKNGRPSIKINHKGDAQHYEQFHTMNAPNTSIKLLNRENEKWEHVFLEEASFKSPDTGLMVEMNHSAAKALGVSREECEGEVDDCENLQKGDNGIRYKKIRIELSREK